VDADRIERALREGPPDEPAYEPGAFRRRSGGGRSPALTGLAIGVALIAGFALGNWLGLMRDGVGTPPSRVLVAADLTGVWQRDPISPEAWTELARARGFSESDIDAFLEHDSFEDQVRYQLRFIDDRYVVQALYDDLPLRTLNEGTFTVGEDGAIRLVEVVNAVPIACEIGLTTRFDGSQLHLDVMEMPGCSVDGRLANLMFFDGATYERIAD
jgi:hypothetical protein